MGNAAVHPQPGLQRALSQKFRADQVRLGQAAGEACGKLFDSGFRIPDARASWTGIRPQVIAIMNSHYHVSQVAGQSYYSACRVSAGLGPVPASLIVKSGLGLGQAGQIADSTGLGAFLHEVKQGQLMLNAFNSARKSLTAAVSATVMGGARDWIEAASSADPQSCGFRRVTSGTCDYCDQLAEAGTHIPRNGGFHNHCLCSNEPAFGRDTGPSPSLPKPSAPASAGEEADEEEFFGSPEDSGMPPADFLVDIPAVTASPSSVEISSTRSMITSSSLSPARQKRLLSLLESSALSPLVLNHVRKLLQQTGGK